MNKVPPSIYLSGVLVFRQCILGQFNSLQLVVLLSKLGPTQLAPPNAGVGLLHCLDLVTDLVAVVPQVTPQGGSDHGVHWLYPPLTETKTASLSEWPCNPAVQASIYKFDLMENLEIPLVVCELF